MAKDNPVRTTAKIWWIVTAVAIPVLVFFFITNAFYPYNVLIIFISFMVALTGLCMALFYMFRARKLDGFMDGDGVLAHWTYSADEWKKYMENEKIDDTSADLVRLVLAGGGTALIGFFIALIFGARSLVWVISLALLLIFLVGVLPWINHSYLRKKSTKYPGEAYIRLDGVYINRRLHIWTTNQVAEFTSVEYSEKSTPTLIFRYNTFGSTSHAIAAIPNPQEVRVPVPQGHEAEARDIIRQFEGTVGQI